MDFYNVFIVICLALITIAVRECARHLSKLTEQLSEAAQKGEDSLKLASEIYYEMGHLRSDVDSIGRVVAQYDNKQPHPYE